MTRVPRPRALSMTHDGRRAVPPAPWSAAGPGRCLHSGAPAGYRPGRRAGRRFPHRPATCRCRCRPPSPPRPARSRLALERRPCRPFRRELDRIGKQIEENLAQLGGVAGQGQLAGRARRMANSSPASAHCSRTMATQSFSTSRMSTARTSSDHLAGFALGQVQHIELITASRWRPLRRYVAGIIEIARHCPFRRTTGQR